MARVALFGGSFNPIHVGHLMAAEGVAEALGLDEVVFVPAGAPPHKQPDALAAAHHRLRMAELATEDNPRFRVWDYEAAAKTTCFTIDTVRAWKGEHSTEDAPPFIIGSDTLHELTTWKDIDELFAECTFVPVPRPGARLVAPQGLIDRVGNDAVQAAVSRAVRIPLVDVSSSGVRLRASEGRSVRYLVPRSVADYIGKHRLYADASCESEGQRSCPNVTKTT